MKRRKNFSKNPDERELVKARVNCELKGNPAEILLELKRRGLVTSARDAVVQGLVCLHEKVLDRDLKEAKLEASERLRREEF